jgi:ABC-2 type transport system ATP-binding protein
MEEADRLADQIAVLDRGRVITAGSPSELKAKVGGDHLELTVPDPEGRRTARELLGARAEPASDAEQQIIRIPLPAGGDVPVAIVAELAARGARVSDLQVHRPALEDVFLHLTGQAIPTAPSIRNTLSRRADWPRVGPSGGRPLSRAATTPANP